MAGGKLGFWSGVSNALVAFGLCVFVIIMLALLVNSLVFGYPDVAVAEVLENTKPVGQVYYRGE